VTDSRNSDELSEAPTAVYSGHLESSGENSGHRHQGRLVADLLNADLYPMHWHARAFERRRCQAVLRISPFYGVSDKSQLCQKGKRAAAASLVLIDGAPGVGKSALLGQLEAFVRKENGRFVSGKFDQYKRNVPYLALIKPHNDRSISAGRMSSRRCARVLGGWRNTRW
jgi:hypothetical protein